MRTDIRISRLVEVIAHRHNIEDTSRQSGLLRDRVEPRLTARIAGVMHTLEEREGEAHVRLRHSQRRRPVANAYRQRASCAN